MKYILMMNGTKANFAEYAKWSKKDMEANVAFMRAFSKQLKDEGVYVATEGLSWPDQAGLVRAGKDGAPITDGVFPESKEFLAGYWIVEVESPEQAYKIAARAPAAPGPGAAPGNMPIEVRPVLGAILIWDFEILDGKPSARNIFPRHVENPPPAPTYL
jgi:hypothetical protein